MKTEYRGIDYGLGKTNKDEETGIRYGVIPIGSISQNCADDLEPHYQKSCPYCGNELDDDVDADNEDAECSDCGNSLHDEDLYPEQPDSYSYDKHGYTLTQGREDSDIFVTKSPYFTYAQFCSPCAPGACHLKNPLTEPHENNKCYCLGPEWFDKENPCPYPIYSVETGNLVQNRGKIT